MDIIDGDGNTLLHLAAKNDNLGEVDRLIREG